MNEIKSCPFCGGKIRYDRAHDSMSIIFRCDICKMVMTFSRKETFEEAIEAFNRRAK